MTRTDRRRAKHRLWNAVVASGLALPLSSCGARTALPIPESNADSGADADSEPIFEIDSSLPPPLLDATEPPEDVGDTNHPHITK